MITIPAEAGLNAATVVADSEALAQVVAEHLLKLSEEAVATRRAFHLALAGGSTPRRCYELMRDMPFPWPDIHVYFGDERCLPVGHAERNDTMAENTLLQHVPIPAKQIHRIPAELGPIKGGAGYNQLLHHLTLDVVLLGMGEDGHTASLFPGNPALRDMRDVVPVFDAPKAPPERISLGYPAIQRARHCLIMAAGEGKCEALSRIQNGEPLPVAAITQAVWFLDQQAASCLR